MSDRQPFKAQWFHYVLLPITLPIAVVAIVFVLVMAFFVGGVMCCKALIEEGVL